MSKLLRLGVGYLSSDDDEPHSSSSDLLASSSEEDDDDEDQLMADAAPLPIRNKRKRNAPTHKRTGAPTKRAKPAPAPATAPAPAPATAPATAPTSTPTTPNLTRSASRANKWRARAARVLGSQSQSSSVPSPPSSPSPPPTKAGLLQRKGVQIVRGADLLASPPSPPPPPSPPSPAASPPPPAASPPPSPPPANTPPLHLGMLGAERVDVPGSLAAKLFPHQVEGVRWLFSRFAARRFRGGLLGDDMGLGKTIQSVAFICALLRRGEPGSPWCDPQRERTDSILDVRERHAGDRIRPVIILAPASLVFQWETEFNKWAPSMHVRVAHGACAKAETAKALDNRIDVLIMSYARFRDLEPRHYKDPPSVRGTTTDAHELSRGSFEALFCDEVHRVKNVKSGIHNSLRYFQAGAASPAVRFGLTGTMMMNDFAEIWSTLDALIPGSCGPEHEFSSKSMTIKRGNRRSATLDDIRQRDAANDELGKLLKQYTLRRVKSVISHMLPQKERTTVICDMAPLQLRAYERVMNSADVQMVLARELLAEKGVLLRHLERVHHSREDGKSVKWSYIMFPLIMQLIKISNHLELIKPKLRDRDTHPLEFQRDVEFTRMLFPTPSELEAAGGLYRQTSKTALVRTDTCGKLQTLTILLEKEYRRKSKVLLFSSYTRVLDILELLLSSKGYEFMRIDGKTKKRLREGICRSFNTSSVTKAFVMLLSTRAAGVGLNLTGAKVVVLFDPSWNPALDSQAQDRAYRIGQRSDVTVYHLICGKSIEQVVYNRQVYKQQLTNLAMSNTKSKRTYDGVQGDRSQPGILFGIHNLLKVNRDMFTPDGDAPDEDAADEPDDADLAAEQEALQEAAELGIVLPPRMPEASSSSSSSSSAAAAAAAAAAVVPSSVPQDLAHAHIQHAHDPSALLAEDEDERRLSELARRGFAPQQHFHQ